MWWIAIVIGQEIDSCKADASLMRLHACHDLLQITDHSEFMTSCPTHTGLWGMYMITPDLQFCELVSERSAKNLSCLFID